MKVMPESNHNLEKAEAARDCWEMRHCSEDWMSLEERTKSQGIGGAEKPGDPMHACLCLPLCCKHYGGKNYICFTLLYIVYPPPQNNDWKESYLNIC